MSDSSMGWEEADSIIELVLMVLFLVVLVTAMAYMVPKMAGYTRIYHTTDKIETIPDAASQNDPFYLTGYQAYMMGWVMSTDANVTLTWLGTASQGGDIPTRSRTDGTNDNHATISTVDENGEFQNNFYLKRNQTISGGSHFGGVSVKDAIRSVVHDVTTDITPLYRGTYERSDSLGNTGKVRFHLELTDDYTDESEEVYSHGGTVLVERRKVFQWVLAPVIIQE